MNETGRTRWVGAALLAGILYLVAGLVFGELARTAGSDQMRTAWRLAAWLLSAVAFGAHIAYEQIRLRSSLRRTALHAALAAALGAFGLAFAAFLHGWTVGRPFPVFALAVWPIMTGLPAFVVAFVAAALLARVRRPAESSR